jgi:TorA maturation chaperone TorD
VPLPVTVEERAAVASRFAVARWLLGDPDPPGRRSLGGILDLVRAGETDEQLAMLAAALADDLRDLDGRGGFAGREYARLFRTDGAPGRCAPLAAWYREGVAVGECTSEIAVLLADEGLDDLAFPADHAATLLGLMEHLLHPGSSPGLEGVLRARNVAHMLGWLPEWAADVACEARHPFFVHAAAFALRAAALLAE